MKRFLSFSLMLMLLLATTFYGQHCYGQELKIGAASISTASPDSALLGFAKELSTLPLDKKVHAKLQELYQQSESPGINVGYVLANGESRGIAVGYADKEAQIPLKANDRMFSGSIGKTYVSAVAFQLAQEKRLNFDEKISYWFAKEPWFNRLPNHDTITVHMLLNHTSGIPEHVLNPDFLKALREQPDRVWQPQELLNYILDAKPLFPAGQGWSYADTNYIIIGMIIEKVTGNTFYQELQQRILKPLALNATTPSDNRILSGLITGYSDAQSPFAFAEKVVQSGKYVVNPQFEWTGGGLVSTAEDLAKWAKLLYEDKVCAKPYVATMVEAVPAKTGPGDKYGFGVQVRESSWGITYGHGGWFLGYLSEMEYFPKYHLAVAVQFNTDSLKRLKRRPRAYLQDIAQVIIEDIEAQNNKDKKLNQ